MHRLDFTKSGFPSVDLDTCCLFCTVFWCLISNTEREQCQTFVISLISTFSVVFCCMAKMNRKIFWGCQKLEVSQLKDNKMAPNICHFYLQFGIPDIEQPFYVLWATSGYITRCKNPHTVTVKGQYVRSKPCARLTLHPTPPLQQEKVSTEIQGLPLVVGRVYFFSGRGKKPTFIRHLIVTAQQTQSHRVMPLIQLSHREGSRKHKTHQTREHMPNGIPLVRSLLLD